MSDVELRTRLALIWALEKTQFKLPDPVSDVGSWEWDDEDMSFVASTDAASFAFHAEVIVGASKRRIAVLTWSDSDGQAIWEGYVPDAVWQGAEQ